MFTKSFMNQLSFIKEDWLYCKNHVKEVKNGFTQSGYTDIRPLDFP